jgi:hypothetical protein
MSGLSTVGLADYFASWDSPLWRGVHAASLTAIRQGFCARRWWSNGTFYDLHYAYFGGRRVK